VRVSAVRTEVAALECAGEGLSFILKATKEQVTCRQDVAEPYRQNGGNA